MGSSSGSGKKNDKGPLLSPRVRVKGSGSGAGGATGGTVERERPETVCLTSFEVDLQQLPILKPRLPLTLKGGQVLLSGTVVGTLGARRRAMVEHCEELGVKYRGTVERRKQIYYGLFRKY